MSGFYILEALCNRSTPSLGACGFGVQCLYLWKHRRPSPIITWFTAPGFKAAPSYVPRKKLSFFTIGWKILRLHTSCRLQVVADATQVMSGSWISPWKKNNKKLIGSKFEKLSPVTQGEEAASLLILCCCITKYKHCIDGEMLNPCQWPQCLQVRRLRSLLPTPVSSHGLGHGK